MVSEDYLPLCIVGMALTYLFRNSHSARKALWLLAHHRDGIAVQRGVPEVHRRDARHRPRGRPHSGSPEACRHDARRSRLQQRPGPVGVGDGAGRRVARGHAHTGGAASATAAFERKVQRQVHRERVCELPASAVQSPRREPVRQADAAARRRVTQGRPSVWNSIGKPF